MSVFAKDFWERVATTAAEGFVGGFAAILIEPADLHLDTLEQVAVAAVTGGVAAAVAAVKALIARRTGDPNSASLVK